MDGGSIHGNQRPRKKTTLDDQNPNRHLSGNPIGRHQHHKVSKEDGARYTPESSLTTVQGVSIGERGTSLPESPSVMKDLQRMWSEMLREHQLNTMTDVGEEHDIHFSELLDQKLIPLMNTLCHLSIADQKLSPEELDDYNTLLREIKQALEPINGKLGSVAGFKFRGTVTHYNDKLQARLDLNSSVHTPEDIENELASSLEAEKKYSQKPTSPRSSPTPKPRHTQLNTTVNDACEELLKLQDQPPSRDLALLVERYTEANAKLQASAKNLPLPVQQNAQRLDEYLTEFKDLDNVQKASELEAHLLTPEKAEAPAPSLPRTDSTTSHSTFPSRSMPKSIPPERAAVFEHKDRQVGIYQLHAFKPEDAAAFRNSLKEITSDGYGVLFARKVEAALTPLLSKEDLDKVSRSIYIRDLEDTYDESVSENYKAWPLKHTQVTVKQGKAEAPMAANRLSIDGKSLGIGMKSPTPDDLPKVLAMAAQENVGVFVDLVSGLDRGKYSHKPESPFDWKTIPDDHPVPEDGEFQIQRTHEKTITFQHKLPNWDKDITATVRKFTITTPDGNKQITQIAFPHWPDGENLPFNIMDELQELVAKEQAKYHDQETIAVNCMAGVGRTGTFYAAKHAREQALENRLDPNNLESEAFNIIAQLKLTRNWECVQTHVQALSVYDTVEEYAKMYEGAVSKSTLTRGTTKVGQFSLEPVKEETAKRFTTECKMMVDDFQSAFKSYKNAYDGVEEVEGDEYFERQENYRITKESLLPKYNKLVCSCMSEVMDPGDAESIRITPNIQTNFDAPTPYETPWQDNHTPPRQDKNTPLTHTQVTVNQDGTQHYLSANHITIDGKQVGIATQSPRPGELDLYLQAIRENNTRIVLDLTNRDDHRKYFYDDPLLDWNNVPPSPQADFTPFSSIGNSLEGGGLNSLSSNITGPEDDDLGGGFTSLGGHINEPQDDSLTFQPPAQPKPKFDIQKSAEDNIEIWTHKDKDYQVVTRTYTIKPTEGTEPEHTFTQISFPDWPDGEPLPAPLLKKLIHKVRADKQAYGSAATPNPQEPGIMVNCVAGLGRTGSYFVGENVLEKVEAGHPHKNTPGHLTLDALMQVRASRSGEMVQTPKQALELIELEQQG